MVQNSPFSPAGEGLIVGQGTRFPHAVGKLSLCIAIIEPTGSAAVVAIREKLTWNQEAACPTKTQHSQSEIMNTYFFTNLGLLRGLNKWIWVRVISQ